MADLFAAAPPGESLWTPSSLSSALSDLLQAHFSRVGLRGEVSGLRRQSSGHQYFALKDEGAVVNCVLFRGNASRSPGQLRDGQQVVAYGDLDLYAPSGRYQLIVRLWEEDGVGRLQREFERLKAKLQGEGLFDPERRRPLPPLPLRVGVVTSPTGAALRDIISILRRRQWSGELRVFPALVQGEQAADSICRALDLAYQMEDLDLIMVSRGGGSLEDLWCFNEESVVRKLAASPVPTLSAVGHEVDFVLTDFVADRRMETPSGAAEWISSALLERRQELAELRLRLRQDLAIRRADEREALDRLAARLRVASPRRLLEMRTQQWDDLAQRWENAGRSFRKGQRQNLGHLAGRLTRAHPTRLLRTEQEGLVNRRERLQRAARHFLEKQRRSLTFVDRNLRTLGPEAVLSRGFTYVRGPDGKARSDSQSLTPGDAVEIIFRDGRSTAKIAKILPNENPSSD